MNMKRIVFFGGAILVMVIIMAIVLHSMTHIDDINHERREKEKGAALASQMVITTETTSIWDALRATETTGAAGGNSANPQPPENPENPEEQPATAPEGEIFPEDSLPEENTPVPQTFTETVEEQQ